MRVLELFPTSVPNVKLNNGYTMPHIGLGTLQISQYKIVNVIKKAINFGYRLIDTAEFYQNEHAIGLGIKAKIDDGTVTRNELFICSKIWDTSGSITEACQKSLNNLGLEYLDLYLIHWPMGLTHKRGESHDLSFVDVWSKMEECVELGLTRSIGLSNFNSSQIEQILFQSSIYPVVNQVENHLYLSQRDLGRYCSKYGIKIMAYSPLSRPYDEPLFPDGSLLEEQLVQNFALKYRKLPSQVALRYLVQLGHIPIPKASRTKHLLQNIEIFNFQFTGPDFNTLHKLDYGLRRFVFPSMMNHPFYPFHESF